MNPAKSQISNADKEARFASAASGTPMLLREADISTEYPEDVDDENLSSQGFSPTLPGELTKVSSALALFKVSRILSKALEQLYPAAASYQLSVNKLHAISEELDQWSQNLPTHLRLQFSKDKPSTGVISCRSPLLVWRICPCCCHHTTDLMLVACLFLYPKSYPPPSRMSWLWQWSFGLSHCLGGFREAHLSDS